MRKILLALAVCTLIPDFVHGQSFERIEEINLPEASGRSYSVDIDGDGDFDVFRVSDGGDAALFLWNGTSFDPIAVTTENLWFDENRVAFRDFDGDGDLDILASHRNSLAIIRYQAPDNFTVVETGIEFTDIEYGDIQWFDVDGDLDPDVIHGRKVFLYDGAGYAESRLALPGLWLKPKWGDVNGDGLTDAVTAYGNESSSGNEVRICLNRGGGAFDYEGISLPYTNYQANSLAVIDADRDGDLDVFSIDLYGRAWIYKNTPSSNGSVTFTGIQVAYPIGATGTLVGDINGDGFEDLVLKGPGSFRVLTNTASGGSIGFASSTLEINLDYLGSACLVDVDGDNDLDIHAVGYAYTFGSANVLYKNLQADPGPIPDVPSNLTADVTQNVTLAWTPVPGMAYNIELRRNGANYLASRTSGAGKLLVPGTESFHRSGNMIVQGLPTGTYEYRIQAVSPSGRVSAFSATAAFQVGVAPAGLSLAAINLQHVKLCWNYGGTGSPSFAVFRALENKPAAEIARVDPGINCYEDSTVPEDETAWYFVTAIEGDSYSANSNTVVHHSAMFVESSFGTTDPNIIESRSFAADFDLDGDYDLGLVGRIMPTGTSILMKNDGVGKFTQAGTLVPMPEFNLSYYGTTGPRDMDNDGDEDLILVTGPTYSLQRLTIFLNNGGSFVKGYESPEYLGFAQVTVEDLNNDGRMDLLFSHRVGNSPGNPFKHELLYQTSDGRFEDSKIVFYDEATSNQATFQCADLNSDGFIDIIWIPAGGTNAEIFANDGGVAFKKFSSILPLTSSMAIGDYTGDGFIDVAVQGNEGLNLYIGKGNFDFNEPKVLPTGYLSSTPDFVQADIDFDGWQDLVFTDGYRVHFLMSKANGSFRQVDMKFAEDWGTSIQLTDLENDGDVDIVKTGNDGQHQGKNFFYRNQVADILKSNLPPSSPATLSVSYVDKKTVFVWAPSTDDRTPQKSLSYNLSVTDANGKIWMNAETNESGKFRRRFGAGNTGHSTTYTLNNLPAGIYTARVQALDASFALSDWSQNVQLIIAQGPTELVVDRILLNKVNLSWKQSPFAESNVLVERKTAVTTWEIIGELPAESTSYVDENLPLNTLYQYRVTEIAGAVETAVSNVAEWDTNLFVFADTEIDNWYGSVDVGDYNSDGQMELLLNGAMIYNGQVEDITKATFKYSSGNWVKTAVTNSQLPHTARIAFADLNGDYKLDIYQSGLIWNSGYKTETFINDGGDLFSSATNVFTSGNFEVPSFVDLDMDNDLDFTTFESGSYPAVQHIYRNDGSGDYSEVAESTCNICSYDYGVADFDRDGDEDVLRRVNNGYKVYFNSPEGFIAGDVALSGSEVSPIVTDYNNDGWPDIVMLSSSSYGDGKIYKNLGLVGSAFPQFASLSVGLGAGDQSLRAGDFDHDGRTDLVVVSPNINVLLNRGDNDFEEMKISDYRISSHNSALVDFDNDGDLDILFGGYYTKDLSWYGRKAKVLLNQIVVSGKGTTNAAPAAPTGLTSMQDSLGMHLTWHLPDDDHTVPTGLTFDVVLYQDGKAIAKGALDPVTGTRLRLRAGTSTGKTCLNNLDVGAYSWRVQAIDASYAGSSLSAEGSFTFVPSPPIVNDTTVYKCGRTITVVARGTDVKWYKDKALTQFLASGEFHPEISQTVYAVQTINGVRGIPKFVRIVIYEKPPNPVSLVNNPLEVCSDLSSNVLMATGESIQWYTDSQLSNVVSTGPILSVTGGNEDYFVTQSLSNCESDPLKLEVHLVEIDSRIYYHDGNLVTRETEGDYYYWYRDDMYFKTTTVNKIAFDGEDAIYVVVVAKNGCQETSEPYLTALITATEDPANETWSVRPNPATIAVAIVAVPQGSAISIFDAKGLLIQKIPYNGIDDPVIDTSQWTRGVYLVVTDDGETRTSKRLVLF
jgi:hypothetical protein